MKLSLTALLVALLSLVWAGSSVEAETIYLKSGSKIVGKVLEKNDKVVKIEVKVDGGTAVMSIKRERIDRIEAATTFEERLGVAAGLRRAEEFKDAEKRYRELVREQPKNPAARMGLAKTLDARFRQAEAVKTLEHYLILVRTGRAPRLMLQLAEYYVQSARYREARKLAREAQALEPGDNSLKSEVQAFLRHVERVRDGTEKVEKRQKERKTEIERRKERRTTFDKTYGTNLDAAQMAEELERWTGETDSKLVKSIFVELTAPDSVEVRYLQGAEAGWYRARVSKVKLIVIVDEIYWLEKFDDRKKVVLYGWYHQLKARYPKTTPVVWAVKKFKDRQGRDKRKNLARGSWDGRRESVICDLWTDANRDPVRRRSRPKK